MIKKLKDLSGKPFGECLAEYYKDQEVEVYLGEKSGSNYYSDYDVEQKVCLSGKFLGAVGEFVLFEARIGDGFPPREVALHSWSITGVSVKDKTNKISLSHIFREMKR